jgi:hypothetical protein
MNTKTKSLALLSVIVSRSSCWSTYFRHNQLTKADLTASVATDSEITPSSSINATDNGPIGFNGFGNGPMMLWACSPDLGMGHRGMDRRLSEDLAMKQFRVSADFTANVTNIAKNDSDVQNLLNQNYNITSIRPVISTTIDGNGNVVTKASTADLTLIGTNGRALVVVDLSQAKVTKIVTMTRTEIDK